MAFTTNRLPISVKGIVFDADQVWLRRNERCEWELPGGKLDIGEQPTDTAVREMWEELGFRVRPADVVSAYVLHIPGSADEHEGVLVVSYLCEILSKEGEFEYLGEAGKAEFLSFPLSELGALDMPGFYKDAIGRAWDLHTNHATNNEGHSKRT